MVFRKGDPIQAKHPRGGEFYFPGEVATVHKNGTYSIQYDDGDFEKNVSYKDIQFIADSEVGMIPMVN